MAVAAFLTKSHSYCHTILSDGQIHSGNIPWLGGRGGGGSTGSLTLAALGCFIAPCGFLQSCPLWVRGLLINLFSVRIHLFLAGTLPNVIIIPLVQVMTLNPGKLRNTK